MRSTERDSRGAAAGPMQPSAPPAGTRPSRRAGTVLAIAVAALAAGCSLPRVPSRPVPPAPPAPPAPSAPAPAPAPARAPAAPAPAAQLPAAPAPAANPQRARNWEEYRLQAALRLVQMNPQITYTSTPPDPLLAIPVLEIEVNGDGSIAAINVQRRPRQALDTVQTAIDAVRRAAPFGPVTHLPRPWRFNETFLFDDARRFKPVTLDR